MRERGEQKMVLGAFFKNTGHHLASWRHPGAQPDAGISIEHYTEMARLAEAAVFDLIFFADSAAVRHKPFDVLSRSAQYTAHLEPITLLSALAMVTSRIGLVATATTSYNAPYHVARLYASLDHISAGRAGWNVVTSGNPAEAWNFGVDEHYAHADRYRRAREFVGVVKGLWDSWDDDAFLYDRESGRFFDPDRVHLLDHEGEFYKVRGPLNVPRPPQGHPVIFQAGTSEDGRDLAAATAEGVFTGQLTLETSAAHYRDVKGRLARYGRSHEDMRILPGCTVYCAATEAEARDKEEYLGGLIHPETGREYIGEFVGIDLSDVDLDEKFPNRPSERPESGQARAILEMALGEGLTVRETYMRLAGSHGKLTMRGTYGQIADNMQDWFDNRACDGFILQPSTMPDDMHEIALRLVPELQNRGLVKSAYEGFTLRDHLGLARPSSRYGKRAAQ